MRKDSLGRLSDYHISRSDINFLVYFFLVRDIKYAIKKYAKGKILDIGCGNKPYEKIFDGLIESYFGCDIVQSSQNRVDLICEATHIPLMNQSFDLIFSTQTIEHVGLHDKMISEAYRLIKPGGVFILSGPMYWPLHEEPYDFFRFTKFGFKLSLERAGFSVVEVLANGGKWALLGQTILQTLPKWVLKPRVFRLLINSFFLWLDRRFYDDTNTMNYVIVAQK